MTMAYENELPAARPTSSELTPAEEIIDGVTEITSSKNSLLADEVLASMEQKLESVDETIRAGLEAEITFLDEWLQLRVKNELVAQVFSASKKSYRGEHSIDRPAVVDVIEAELSVQKARSEQLASHIDELIPEAAKRFYPDHRDPNKYWNKDVSNLEMRRDIKTLASLFIEQLQNTGDSGLKDLSEQYINQTSEIARTEVINYLAQENNQLVQEIADRDMKLHDLEVESFIAQSDSEITK